MGLLVVGAIIATFISSANRPNITLTASPSVALLKLDGVAVIHPGKLHVSAGQHSITGSFAGFSNQKVTFTTKSGSLQEVRLLLNPSTQEGYDWLLNHPEEQKIRQGIGGQNFHATVQKQAASTPLTQLLPYIGPGSTYRIDYGSTPGDTSGTSVSIIITYYTQEGQQAALNWISQQGYNPSSLNIVYHADTATQLQTNNPNTD